VALGWGLWEGPARFFFCRPKFFRLPGAFLFPLNELSRLDFQRKWHNIMARMTKYLDRLG